MKVFKSAIFSYLDAKVYLIRNIVVNKVSKPIGVLDSGSGGLTVLKELKRLLPNENFVYLADTANLPYGTKSKEQVEFLTVRAVKYLKEKHDIKAMVIACNTATTHGMRLVAAAFPELPCCGVVLPGAKAAASATKTGNVFVLATASTVGTGIYKDSILGYNPYVDVSQISVPVLISLAEENWVNNDVAVAAVKEYLKDLPKDCDTLVYGCTHLPPFTDVIKKIAPNLNLIDSAKVVAQAVCDMLGEFSLKNPQETKGSDKFLVTDLPKSFAKRAVTFLGRSVDAKEVSLVSLLEKGEDAMRTLRYQVAMNRNQSRYSKSNFGGHIFVCNTCDNAVMYVGCNLDEVSSTNEKIKAFINSAVYIDKSYHDIATFSLDGCIYFDLIKNYRKGAIGKDHAKRALLDLFGELDYEANEIIDKSFLPMNGNYNTPNIGFPRLALRNTDLFYRKTPLGEQRSNIAGRIDLIVGTNKVVYIENFFDRLLDANGDLSLIVKHARYLNIPYYKIDEFSLNKQYTDCVSGTGGALVSSEIEGLIGTRLSKKDAKSYLSGLTLYSSNDLKAVTEILAKTFLLEDEGEDDVQEENLSLPA